MLIQLRHTIRSHVKKNTRFCLFTNIPLPDASSPATKYSITTQVGEILKTVPSFRKADIYHSLKIKTKTQGVGLPWWRSG